MSIVQPEHTVEVTREEIDTFRKQIVELDTKLKGRYFAPELQDLGLLDGLTQPEKYDKIKERLKAHAREKESLSDYLQKLVQDVLRPVNPKEDPPSRLFIESGSTLAVFSADSARESRADERPLHSFRTS
jgi:hypothetical protein